MTVSELIVELSQFPEDMDVAIQIDFDKWRDIRKVGYAKRYKNVCMTYKETIIAVQGIVAIE